MTSLRRFVQAAVTATLLTFWPAAFGLEMPWNWHDEHVVQASRLMQWRQLNTSRAVLATAPVPSGWLAGAYLSGNLIDQVMRQQAGTVLEVKGLEKIDDLKIDIKGLDINFRVESPEVLLNLVASSKKRGVSVAIKGRGLLGYVGTTTTKGANPRPMAVFQVVMTHARPAVDWSNFSVSMPSFMKEFIAAGVMKYVGDELQFEFPLTESPVLSLGDPPAPDRPEVKIRKKTVPIKKTGGSIELEIGHRNVDLPMPLNFATPLFTSQGVWLLASDKSFVPPADPEPSKLTDSTVEALRRLVEAMLKGRPAPDADAALFLNQRALVELINKVRLLPEAHRSAYAKSLSSSGNLFQDKWRDDVFGKGGIFVRGAKNDFLQVTVVLDDLRAQWAPKEGLHLTAEARATVAASLHWHFDPLVSGGFGDDVGIGGRGKVAANGAVTMRLVDLGDGQSAALIVPSLSCTVAPIEMSADAGIKLGVKTGVKVFEERMTPTALLSTQPMRVAFPMAKPKPNRKVQVLPRWAKPALDVVTHPSAADATDDGFYISAKLTSLAAAAPDADDKAAGEREKNVRDAMKKKLDDYAKTLPEPACPSTPDLRINIGDIEIGPNNELVKYSAAALDVINRTFQEGKKIIKTPGKAIKDAPGNVTREVKKGIRRICGKFC